jgi:hypothetical protein
MLAFRNDRDRQAGVSFRNFLYQMSLQQGLARIAMIESCSHCIAGFVEKSRVVR